MAGNSLTSNLRQNTSLFQQGHSSAVYNGNYIGKPPPHFSSSQIVQFDNPPPGVGDLGHGWVRRKADVLDCSVPSFKPQANRENSQQHRTQSLPASQKISEHPLPVGILTSEPDDDVINIRGDSPSWYTDVTNMIAQEPLFQNNHTAKESGYYTSVFDPHLNTGVIKYNGSPVPRSMTPCSLLGDSRELSFNENQFSLPLKRDSQSPMTVNSEGTPVSLHGIFPQNGSCDTDSLKSITFPSYNGFYPGGGHNSGSVSMGNHQQMNGNVSNGLDFQSGSNSVDSVLSCDDNGLRFNDANLSELTRSPLVRYNTPGSLQNQQQQQHQHEQQQQQQQSYHHKQHQNFHPNVGNRESQSAGYHRETTSISSSISSLSPSSTTAGLPSSQISLSSVGDTTATTMSTSSGGEPAKNENSSSDNLPTTKSKHGGKSRGAQNLPPCRVCGNKASGLHFGVNTCEACNEFFRRSLKRGATYYCTKNRECQVYGKKRNACSYCRYQRCVEMGMSRDAIKTGRYSHKTRTEYAIEVEEFRQREVNRVEKERYEVLLNDLVKYHDKYVNATTRVPDDDLQKSQSAYLHLYQTQREHELRHPPLGSTMQSKSLLNGWRTDKEDLTLTMHDVEMTERWLRNYINFAKNVPGFKELALSDQASLVRGSWFEFWFLGAYRGYNSHIRVVIYPNRRCFHEEEIKKVFGEEYCDISFYLSDRMRILNVTPEEMVLIKTVCLTFPDRTTLENKDAVEKMHWLMVSCLLHTLEKNRPGDRTIFPLIVSKLVELRTLTEIAMRAHRRAVFQDVLKDSPLLCEMVDTKTTYVRCAVHNNTAHPPKCSAGETP